MATVGYSSRCKVCNSLHRSEIERWIREGISYRQVSRKLSEEHEETISHPTLVRHMAEHFNVVAATRDKYEKTKIQEQHEQSQRLMDEESNKLLSEIEMLDQVARMNFQLYMASHSWLMELINDKFPKIPIPLVSLAKMASEELRQHLKQKQELLGEAKEEDKKLDFADLLLSTWDRIEQDENVTH